MYLYGNYVYRLETNVGRLQYSPFSQAVFSILTEAGLGKASLIWCYGNNASPSTPSNHCVLTEAALGRAFLNLIPFLQEASCFFVR